MPIGKNAIKRVEINGYLKVKTSAPDMENSCVLPSPAEEAVEKLIAPVEETVKKKAVKTSVKTVKNSKVNTSSKKTVSSQKTANKSVKTKNGFERVSFGEDLPYYLL